MRRVLARTALAILLAAALGPTAEAAYIGGALVSTDAELEAAAESFDDDDTGFKLFGGFTLLGVVGIEASYRDLGTLEAPGATGSLDVDLEVWDVAARGRLPLPGPLSIVGRLGVANVSIDGSLEIDDVVSSLDEDDWERFWGVGLEAHLGSRLGLRVEWERFDFEEELDTLSAGAFVRF